MSHNSKLAPQTQTCISCSKKFLKFPNLQMEDGHFGKKTWMKSVLYNLGSVRKLSTSQLPEGAKRSHPERVSFEKPAPGEREPRSAIFRSSGSVASLKREVEVARNYTRVPFRSASRSVFCRYSLPLPLNWAIHVPTRMGFILLSWAASP